MDTQIKNITTIHKGKYRDLVSAEFITRSGDVQKWEYLHEYNESAMILPITESGNIVLIDEFRIPIQSRVLSLPAGTFEPYTETASSCAKRELEEETGYSAKDMYFLGTFFGSPAISNRKVEVFVAFGVEKNSETNFDDNEDIVVCEYGYNQVKEMFLSQSRHIHTNIFAAYEMARIKFPEKFSC